LKIKKSILEKMGCLPGDLKGFLSGGARLEGWENRA